VSELVIRVGKSLDLMLDFGKKDCCRTLDVCCNHDYLEPFTKLVGISYCFSIVLLKNIELSLKRWLKFRISKTPTDFFFSP